MSVCLCGGGECVLEVFPELKFVRSKRVAQKSGVKQAAGERESLVGAPLECLYVVCGDLRLRLLLCRLHTRRTLGPAESVCGRRVTNTRAQTEHCRRLSSAADCVQPRDDGPEPVANEARK